MNRNVVGLGIAEQVFHLFMMQDGKAIKRKLRQSELLAFIAQLPPSVIALETCGGSHHWARSFQQLGHEVKLLNARYVKAFLVGNKNDFKDARRFLRRRGSRTNVRWRLKTWSNKILPWCMAYARAK